MKKKSDQVILNLEDKNNLLGYPLYPVGEDIYAQDQEETELNPEDISTNKKEVTENDLDVPGSELDDAQEEIGSEDEENNFYSLGGDNHDNLEESKTE